MSTVGQIERATQNRVVTLLKEQLGYTYLGNWEVRQDNSNIEERYLRPFLKRQEYSEALIRKALFDSPEECKDQARRLYDINKSVYGLLRYGVSRRRRSITWPGRKTARSRTCWTGTLCNCAARRACWN